jgi:hypothetical protein
MRLVKNTLSRSGSWKPSSIGLPVDQSHCGVYRDLSKRS